MRKFIHFLTLSIMLSVVYVPGYCAPEDDYIALRALYLSTDGDYWINNNGWLTEAQFIANPTMPPGTDFSTWFGIITHPNNTVERLDLYANGLSGQIPVDIGAFTDIMTISLDYNQLFGPIPYSIGDLWNLDFFSASGNQLNGDIPPTIGFLNNLSYLVLSDNQLTGMIPQEIGMMQNLRHLYLDYNQLFGDIPFQIGNASNLEEIELAANQLTGIIPPEIEFLMNLQHLDLSLNQLTGDIPPSFGNLMSLTHLELSGNQITGSIPADLANLTNLQFMLLFNNQLTGCYDPALASLCGQLDPTYNNNAGISDGNMLDASWDNFCASGMGDCSLPPAAACVARDYEALRAIYLNTDGDNWTRRDNWPNETYFMANPTAAPGTDLSTWYGLTVNAGGCVTELRLHSNNLIGTIPSEIGNMIDLTMIQLEANQLSGIIPPEVGNLTLLEDFRLYTNQLTGIIPPEIGNLTNLIYLHLSFNQLSGPIPPEVGNLTNLLKFGIAFNQLTGNIPVEIGNMSSLTELFLNANQLTGSIPVELAALSNLQIMGLHTNQLTGCYDPAFATFCGQLIPSHNNNAVISDGNMLDANWEDFCASGMGECSPAIFDLALTTTLSSGQPSSVAPGDAVSFDIMVMNQGTADAYNILVNDYVPAGYVFDPAMNPNLLDIDGDNNPDHMIAGPLTPGVAYMFSIVLIVNNPFTGAPDDLVNYAEISEADDDTDPTNMPPMDIDSSPDNDPANDAGGTPNGPDDDYVAGDGTGMPLDGVAATDEDDQDPAFVTVVTSTCVANDYEALRALYLNTNGDFWANNSGWPDAAYFMANPTAPPFTNFAGWYGIDVDFGTGCVINVLLGGNGLDGIIPPEIGMLSNVFHINLKFNNLMSDIPPEFGNLTNLVVLELGFNQFTGMIPPDLGNLSALQFLELQSNQLYGCYDPMLMLLCSQLDPLANTNQYISDGNMLDAPWEDFCNAGMGACYGCPFDLFINDIPMADGVYQAESIITATGEVAPGGQVEFKAGDIIILDMGFSTDAQADFSAEIDTNGCTP